MPLKISKELQFGELGSAITAGQTTLPTRPGQGARFDTLAAGDIRWGLIRDDNETGYNRFEFFKHTGQGTDQLNVIRGQLGTTAKAFPITGGNPASNVKILIGDSVANLMAMVDGAGAIIQATAPTLSAFSPRNIVLNPGAPITVNLPTTDVWAGKGFRFVNLGSAAITINASGGGKVADLPALSNLELFALQDAPTAASHWGVPATFFPDGSFLFAAGAGGATHRGGGALLDASGNPIQVTADSARTTTGDFSKVTMPGKTLSRDGSFVSFYFAGTRTGAAGTFSLQPKLGATSLGAAFASTVNSLTAWILELMILRVAAGSQKFAWVVKPNRDDTGSTTLVGVGTAAADETTDLDVLANLSAISAGTVTQTMLLTDFRG